MQNGICKLHVTPLWTALSRNHFLQKSFRYQYYNIFGKICKDFIPKIFVIYLQYLTTSFMFINTMSYAIYFNFFIPQLLILGNF